MKYLHTRATPLAILTLWFIFLGIAVANHAYRSQQPPIYDAFSYYQKAQLVWANLTGPHPSNPLNIAPTFRPPGTVLQAYPFGFDPDFRGFYFRSAYFPVVLVGMGAIVIAYRRSAGVRDLWTLLAIVALITTLPTFYHFELSPGLTYSSWGLVDNFLGGVAAFAAACMARSVRVDSLRWLIFGAFSAALCIMIKPAGVLLAALVTGVWLVLSCADLLSRPRIEREAGAWRRLLARACVLGVIEGMVLLAAMRSQYLSRENLDYGTRAIVVMRSELNIHIEQLWPLIRDDFGFAVPLWLAVMVIAWWTFRFRSHSDDLPPAVATGLPIVLSLGVLAFGIWFWLFGSGGGTQVRYFDPFLMVAVVVGIPTYAHIMVRFPKPLFVPIVFVMLLPALNLATLLALNNPPRQWQIASGVNLTAGAEAPGLAPARALVASLHDRQTSILVYSTSVSFADAMFSAVFQNYMATHPQGTRFGIHRPVDWQRPTTYRLRDIIHANYLLNDPLARAEDASAILSQRSISSQDDEQRIFRAWASSLGPEDGVETVYGDSTLMLFHIRDPAALSSSLDKLVRAHEWRSVFIEANPMEWWRAGEIDDFLRQSPAQAENVHFGKEFIMRAVNVQAKDGRATLRFWWAAESPVGDGDWSIFAHATDASGRILIADGFALGRIEHPPAGFPFHFDELTISMPPGTARLAVGFYRNGATLPADRGERDSGGHRLLLQVPGSTKTEQLESADGGPTRQGQ